MRKWKIFGIGSILLVASLILVLFLTPSLRSQIQQVSGLAVAQTSTQWNNMKDGAVGDNITNGVGAVALYGWDSAGANFDRVRVDTSGNLKITPGTGTDPISGALITIDEVHANVHAQVFYTSSDFATGVNIASPKYWRVLAPNTTKRIHFVASVSVGAAARVEFWEAPTITGNGTGLNIFNNDRNSSNTATASTFKDTTVSADGTLLEVVKLGSNTNQTQIGGTARQQVEFILKQNTSYDVKVTTDADGNTVTMVMQWYEE